MIKILDREGKNPKEWVHVKETLTKAFKNVNPKQVVCTKLSKLSQHLSVETHWHNCQTTSVEITY